MMNKCFPNMVQTLILFQLTVFCLPLNAFPPNQEVINPTRFGIKGDGRTDNTAAFQRLADYINNKGGNAVVVFGKGTYMGGAQDKLLKREGFFLSGADVLALKNVKNVTLKGETGAIFKYNSNLYFGSFETPSMTKLNVKGFFVKPENGCYVGNFISFNNSYNITVEGLTLEGNDENSIGGGIYGEFGIQIPYTGLNIINTQNVIVRNLIAQNFGLDGVIVSNRLGIETKNDSVYFYDCLFSKNGRQGLSWISGNHLEARNCRFELTGRGKYSSDPGAGLDIEAEEQPIRNGLFKSCTFFNNTGSAMVSGSGDVANCSFDSCSFIGLTNWSVWVEKPGFVFRNCSFWGAGVHGYKAETDAEATKYLNCRFTDEPYEGKFPTYGDYLYLSTGSKRLFFQDCFFEAKKRKLLWLDGNSFSSPDENYQLINCSFTVTTELPINDFYLVFRRVTLKNSNFQLGKNIRINKNIASGIDVETQTNIQINNRKTEL